MLEHYMSDHIEYTELSAYMDGESARTVAVESHLHTCDTCKAKMVSLQDLRDSLNALSEPEIHPAFATRVRASIEADDSFVSPIGFRSWVYSLTGVAAAALLTFSLYSTTSSPTATPGVTVAPAQSGVAYASLDRVEEILQQDEAELAARLESQLGSQWVDGAMVTATFEVSTAEAAGGNSEFILAAMTNSEPEAIITDQWLDNTDSITQINRLTDQQSDLFKEMLVMHARETLLGDAAFEG